jgi:hypothetical protein
MAPGLVRGTAEDRFWSFVRELARSPGLPALLGRLRHGHYADSHGWCGHSSHDHHWAHHPCPVLQLADLVEHLDPEGGQGPTTIWRRRLG